MSWLDIMIWLLRISKWKWWMLKNLKESLLLPRPHPKTPPTRILLGSTIREREMSESRRSITRESCDRQFILIRLPVNLQRQVAISFGRCDVIEAQRGYLIISFPPPSPFHSFSLSLFLSFSLSRFLGKLSFIPDLATCDWRFNLVSSWIFLHCG